MQTPTSKVTFGASAGAIVTVIVYVLGQFGYSIPPEVSASAVTIITFLTGYIKAENNPSQ